jgi:autotransporter-associated beta strand protein
MSCIVMLGGSAFAQSLTHVSPNPDPISIEPAPVSPGDGGGDSIQPAPTPVSGGGGGGTTTLSTSTYTIQTVNFSATQNSASSGGFAGEFNNSATEVGFFAHGGSGQDDASAFQTFTTNGVGSGTARKVQVGDSFSITMFSASNPFGFEGVYFDDNTTYTSFSNYNTNERTAVVLGPSGNWVIENNGTNVDTGIGSNNSITAVLTVTSSNTFNMAITNNSNSTTTTYYDLVMKNAPGTTTRIQSFSLIDQNDNNANFFVKNGSLTNTGSITLGGSNLNLTNSGVITDGLDSASTSTNSVNSVTKIGTNTMVLSGANTYTGTTTINAGTLSISSDGNLGTAPGSVTANSLNFTPAASGSAALVTTANMTLNSNRGITLNSGGTNFIGVASGTTLTYGGIIAGTSFLVKNQSGTLLLTGANTFTGGTNNLFIDEGTVSVGTGGTLGTSSGLINLGSSVTSGLNSALDIANANVIVTNPIDIRFFTGVTGGKTIQTSNGTGTATYSGNVTLHDTVTFQAATNGTVNFTGAIAQGTATGGQAVNGTPGLLIGSAGNAGTVILSSANTYAGSTAVNAGKLFVNGGVFGTSSGTGSGNVTVSNSGTTLGGSGAIGGSISIGASAKLAPGASGDGSTAILHTGALTLTNNTSIFSVDLNNTTPGTGYDRVVASSIALNNATLALTVGTLNAGDQFVIGINSSNGSTGQFNGLAEGASFNQGVDAFTISYLFNSGDGTANDILLTVTAVPEPGTWVAGALVFASLLLTQRRRLTHLVRRQGSSATF